MIVVTVPHMYSVQSLKQHGSMFIQNILKICCCCFHDAVYKILSAVLDWLVLRTMVWSRVVKLTFWGMSWPQNSRSGWCHQICSNSSTFSCTLRWDVWLERRQTGLSWDSWIAVVGQQCGLIGCKALWVGQDRSVILRLMGRPGRRYPTGTRPFSPGDPVMDRRALLRMASVNVIWGVVRTDTNHKDAVSLCTTIQKFVSK